MVWIVFTFLLSLLAGGGLIVAHNSENEVAVTDRYGDKTANTKKNPNVVYGLLTAGVSVVLILILTAAFSVHTVAQRQVGIVKNFSGTITGITGTGVVLTAPWQHILKENTGLQREDFVLDENNSAVSSDQQAIYADLTLNYHLNPDTVLNLYRTVGPNWKAILIDSRVLQDFKEVTATFTAQEITTKREQLRQLTKTRLSAELTKHDISVDDFFVKNLGYTQSYRDAISAKNVQVQQALQAQAKVAQARAEAEQAVATAKGEATAIRLKGSALRDNPSILSLEAIDKLNPNAQVIFCTDKNCPSFLPASLFSAVNGGTGSGN